MSTKTPCGNKFCGKTGLMLLPLRYAVAASEEGHAEFPELSGTLGQGVADKKLRTAAYTVRMMRQGFLYVMTKRSGKLKWESAWAVNHQGYISRIALGDAVQPPEFTCTTKGDDINASMISIEKAQDVSEFRVLFLPDPLSKAALSKIESDSKLHNKLQKFQAKAVVQPHALQPGDLRSKVVEFRSIEGGERKLAPRFNDHMYPFFGAEAKLIKNEPYPYTGRLKNLGVELLNKKGMAIVLHDPLGLAQELNTWRNLSIARLNTVMTTESTVFAKYTNEQLMAIISTVNDVEEKVRNGAISLQEPKLAITRAEIIKQAQSNPNALRAIPPNGIYENEAEYEKVRQEWRKQNAKRVGDKAWEKYAKRLWPKASYNAVLNSFKALGDVCDQKNEERAQDLMPWLNAPLLHDTLGFYDDQHFESGVAYAGQMGFCVHGLNSCSIGQEWLIKQVEHKNLKPSAMMFKAGMLNYKTAAEAYVAKGGLSDALSPYEKIQEAGKGISDVWSKIKDLAEKLETVAHVSGVSTAHLGGVNLLLLQLGHAGLARMPGGKLLDKQVLRAGVIHRLLSLSLGTILNKDLAAAYPNPAAFDAKSVAAAKAQRNQINNALTAASKSNSMNGLRFGSVVAMLEMMNVMMKAGKLGEKPAQREAWELLAASLGLGAVMLELTGSVCEKIGQSRNPALISGSKVGVGALKLVSGSLGTIAGGIGAFVDFDSAADEKQKAGGKTTNLSFVYQLRGIVSISGALVGAGIALGASGPFLEWMLQRANGPLYKEALKLALRASARLAAERMALLLLRGARLFTIVGIGLTVAIWIFSDNALESWCDKSCLRKNRKAGSFGSVAEESAALDAAVLEVS